LTRIEFKGLYETVRKMRIWKLRTFDTIQNNSGKGKINSRYSKYKMHAYLITQC
jgi:hypothetical protein